MTTYKNEQELLSFAITSIEKLEYVQKLIEDSQNSEISLRYNRILNSVGNRLLLERSRLISEKSLITWNFYSSSKKRRIRRQILKISEHLRKLDILDVLRNGD